MGSLYIVVPLHKDCTDWLDREGISYPAAADPRMPSPRELKGILLGLDGFKATFRDEQPPGKWSVAIESTDPEKGEWSSLYVSDYISDEEPCDFYFSKGHAEVAFTVVKRLTPICGAMVVCTDCDAWPVVVRPEDSVEDLVTQLENPWPEDS